MAPNIGRKIEDYASKHLRELKQQEAKTGKKFTKYDIAIFMIQNGQLNKTEFASWMNTREGFDAQTMSKQQELALKRGSVFGLAGYGGGEESYLDSLIPFSEKSDIEKFNIINSPNKGLKFGATKEERAKRDKEIKTEIKQQKVKQQILNPKKAAEEQKLIHHLNSLPEVKKEYDEIMAEIKAQDEASMSHDERKKFIMSKFLKAWDKGEKLEMMSALEEFNSYMCSYIDGVFRVTDAKESIKEIVHLNDVVDAINKYVDDNNDETITFAEGAWEFMKGLGDAADSLIGAQGVEMAGVFGAAGKAIQASGKFAPVLGGLMKTYFGAEASKLLGESGAKMLGAEKKEDFREAGTDAAFGVMMAHGTVSGLGGIKGSKAAEIANKKALADARKTLGLAKNVEISPELLKQAYKSASLKNHPDKGGSTEAFQKVQNAYELLKGSLEPAKTSEGAGVKGGNDKVNQGIKNNNSDKAADIANPDISETGASEVKSGMNFNQALQALKSSNTAKVATDNEGNKIIVAHRNALNLCDYTYYKFDKDGNFIETGKIPAEKMKDSGLAFQKVGEGQANLSLDFGIVESLIKTVKTNLAHKIITYKLDEKFCKREIKEILRYTNGDNISVAEKLCTDKDFPKEEIKEILCYTKKYNISLVKKLCADKDFPKEEIKEILWCTNKDNISFVEKLCTDKDFSKEEIKEILRRTDEDNISLVKKLCADKDFPIEDIKEILCYTKKYNISFAEKLCTDKDFPKEEIKEILWRTNEDNISFAEKLCADKEFPQKHITSILVKLNKYNCLPFAQKLYNDKEFPNDLIMYTCKPDMDAEFTEELCSLVKDLSKEYASHVLTGLLVHTNKKNISVVRTCCTKSHMSINDFDLFNHVNEKNSKLAEKIILDEYIDLLDTYDLLSERNKNDCDVLAELYDKLSADKEIPRRRIGAILKLSKCDSKENNTMLLELALATKKLDKSKIESLMRTSLITDVGDDAGGNAGHVDEKKVRRFVNLLQNPKTSPYVVKLLNNGVDMDTVDFLTKTRQNFYAGNSKDTPSNDFSDILTKKGYNEKEVGLIIRSVSGDGVVEPKTQQIVLRLLDNGVEPAQLRAVYNSYFAPEPVKPQIVRTSEKIPPKAKVVSGFRSRESVKGLERKIIDQYQPAEQIWRNEEATKKWAEEKYQAMRNQDYISTRNTAEDPELAQKITQQRRETLAKWYEFLETDETIKDNPFAKIIIMQGITEDLLPENSKIAVEFDKTLAKKIIAEAMDNSANVSFKKSYNKELNKKRKVGDKGEKIDFDGVKGTMYTVPQTDSSSPDFEANVAKVKAYSDGTNWCIRSWNAAPYIQQGAMHFFVDEHGLTQVCVRENAPGQVAEIQKRQQNATRPIPYITVIKDYLDRHEIKYPDGYLDEALKAKPAFDKMKAEIQTLCENKDYKGILEKLGITVTVKPDGTWELSHYSANIDKFTLNDLGINENDLLANVSSIKGDADFANSNATSLQKLEHVEGKFSFVGSNIVDVRNLKEINGFKIDWK